MFLPSASATVMIDGEKTKMYSPLITSFLGPAVVALYITALVLIYHRRVVLAAISSFAGVGFEAYFIFNKVADVEAKMLAKGYETAKCGVEYGTYMSQLAVACVLIGGLVMLAIEFNDSV